MKRSFRRCQWKTGWGSQSRVKAHLKRHKLAWHSGKEWMIEKWTGRFKMCISKLKSNNLLKYYLWRIYWYTLPRTSNMFLFPFLTHWCNMSQPIYISARFPWQIGAISSSEVEALAAVLQELLLAAEEVSCPVPVERCVPGCSLSFRSFVQTRLSYCMKSLPFW